MDGQQLASERWKILREAILAAARGSRGHTEPNQQASVRSFTSFGLLSVIDLSIDKTAKKEDEVLPHSRFSWKRYTYRDAIDGPRIKHGTGLGDDDRPKSDDITEDLEISASIRHLPESTSFEAMLGFNNTGNVCVWPSEEVLAYYCLKNREQFRGKSICELGAGMTGLAGVLLSLTHLPFRTKLTDGNPASVENMRFIVEENRQEFGDTPVSTDVLVWDQNFLDSDYSKYDVVICADCLFFVELHAYLYKVIHKLVVPGGRALIFSPRRNGTLDQFVERGRGLFSIREIDNYDDVIWSKHCLAKVDKRYKPDLHYPILLILDPL